VIFGDGTQTRDFIYIDDLVGAIVRAASLEEGGEIFQIATNRETSVNEIAQMLSDLIREMAGLEVDIDYAQPRTGEILRNYADVSKANRMLGWCPQRSLREGLRETVKWYVEKERAGASA
jgi:UDP-glucose 4-epimerase